MNVECDDLGIFKRKGGISVLTVTLPGTGGTVPRKDRWLATYFMRYNGSGLLIDC